MEIKKIQSAIMTPRVTGYSAVSALGLTMLSRFSKNKNLQKTHRPFAWLTVGLTLLHVGLIEYMHHKYKKGAKG